MPAGFRVTVFAAQAAEEARRASAEGRREIAEQAVDIARSTAPVQTGEYRAGFAVEASGDRVAVVNNDPEALHKELGTSDTPAHMTTINAARQFGRYTGSLPKRGR